MMTELRAITVKQPWAWAIVNGHKTVENRSRPWPPGRYAVHAGARWSNRGAHDDRIARASVEHATARGLRIPDPDLAAVELASAGLPRAEQLYPTGAVLGLVDICEAHPDNGCCRPWGESLYAEGAGRIRTVVHHLRLEHPLELPEPIYCPGRLGPWRLPTDVERRVLESLTAKGPA